jgi:hypothetical protein
MGILRLYFVSYINRDQYEINIVGIPTKYIILQCNFTRSEARAVS